MINIHHIDIKCIKVQQSALMGLKLETESKQAVASATPIVTKARFSEMSGLTEETLRGMIERGHLPTMKIGKHRMINVALLTKECLEQEFEGL